MAARRKAAPKAKPKAKADPAAELEVLFPDADVEVRDPDTGKPVTLTVREFRFREGLEAQAAARDLIAELARLSERAAGGGEKISLAAVDAAIGAHAEAWLDLIARATGRDAEWLARLSDEDARAVTGAMWSANGPFFVRRVHGALVADAWTASLFRSPASSTPSSAPDTGGALRTSAGA